MTRADVVEMFMSPETGGEKRPAKPEDRPAHWRFKKLTQNRSRIDYLVSYPTREFHGDNLQLSIDHHSMPGAIVFSPTTMVDRSTSTSSVVRPDPHFDATEARMSRLAVLTTASGDPFNKQSAARLLAFCHNLAADRKPAIFPLLNGHLRALWENDAQEQIGIQFLPDGTLQYVLFCLNAGKLIETMGTELDERGLYHLIDVLGLRRLWFNGGR